MKKATDNKKLEGQSKSDKPQKELTPKEEVKYKTWLHSSNPFIFNKIYGGKK